MTHSEHRQEQDTQSFLKDGLTALLEDYSRYGTRIRELVHSVESPNDGVNLRLHYPALRGGKATIEELTDALGALLTKFCLPRSLINDTTKKYKDSPHQYIEEINRLFIKAKRLFKLASKAANKNGEAGELLLFLLTEWILEAPQILAKMSLKTNSEMAVHGADGVHARYCETTNKLFFYWGESKLYSNINRAISEATKSLSTALLSKNIQHEIELVKNNIDFSDFPPAAKEAFLKYLDPFEEESNLREDVATCLIAFDFDAYKNLIKTHESELVFRTLAEKKLLEVSPKIAKSLRQNGLLGTSVEFFIFPLPSVSDFRNAFQGFIGWKS